VTERVIAQVKNGKVDLYNASTGTVDLTADVVGYYSSSGSLFHPMGSTRPCGC